MDDCKTAKKRCLTGPCIGLAYTAGGECPEGSTFDSSTCQCESGCVRTGDAVITITPDPYTYQLCLNDGADCGSERTHTADPIVVNLAGVQLPLRLEQDNVEPIVDANGCVTQGRNEWIVYDGDGNEVDRVGTGSLGNPMCPGGDTMATATYSVAETPTPCSPGYEFNPDTCECEWGTDYADAVGVWEIGIESWGELGLRASATFLVDIPEPYFNNDGALVQKVIGRIRSSSPASNVWASFDPDGPGGVAPCEGSGQAYYIEPFTAPGMQATLDTAAVCDDIDDPYQAGPGSAGHLGIMTMINGCTSSYDIIYGGNMRARCWHPTVYSNGKISYLGRGTIDGSCCAGNHDDYCNIGTFSTSPGAGCFIPEA